MHILCLTYKQTNHILSQSSRLPIGSTGLESGHDKGIHELIEIKINQTLTAILCLLLIWKTSPVLQTCSQLARFHHPLLLMAAVDSRAHISEFKPFAIQLRWLWALPWWTLKFLMAWFGFGLKERKPIYQMTLTRSSNSLFDTYIFFFEDILRNVFSSSTTKSIDTNRVNKWNNSTKSNPLLEPHNQSESEKRSWRRCAVLLFSQSDVDHQVCWSGWRFK